MSEAASTLQFRVLGSLEVLDDEGELLGVRGLRRRALLLRLLVDANRVVPSDALIEDVWSGRPPNDAVGTLQSHISLLRRLLGPRLHSRRPGYLLTVADGELDAHLFEGEVAQARGLLENAEAAKAASLLLETLERWRGQALLDVAGLPWAVPTAVHLEQLRFNAIELGAEALLLANRVDEAVALARAAAEEEPLRERLWTHLMVGLARQGRQAEALRAYQRVRAHLAEQLGIEPSPSLLALEDAILMQRPIGAVWQPSVTASADPVLHVTIEPHAGEDIDDHGELVEEALEEAHLEVDIDVAPAATVPVPEVPPAGSMAVTGRLVGRDAELARAQGVLDAALHDGQLHTLLVTAGPGMGRSRFAREVARQAHAGGWHTLTGSFGPEDGSRVDPFEEIRVGLDLHDELVGGPVAARDLVEALAELAEKRPLCIVLREVQHANGDNLATLQLLLNHLRKSTAVIVLCGVGLDFHENRGVSTLLWRLHRQGPSEWIRLEGFSPEDLQQLSLEVRGTEMTLVEAERLHQVTGGNPLLASEALRWDGGQTVQLPELAELYTEQFLSLIGRDAIEAATVVAIFGDWVSVELVAELRSKSPLAVVEALDAASKVGLVEGDGRGSFRITVPLVASLLVNRVSTTQRTMLHREIASRLPDFATAESSPAVALAVADHWLSGARGQDALRVYEAAREAAGHMLSRGDPESALPWLALAQRLSEGGTHPTDADRAELLFELVRTRASLGHPLSMPLWREALAAAREAGDVELRAQVVLCQPAWPWVAVDEPRPFARSTVEAALNALPSDETALRSRLLASLAAGQRWTAMTRTEPGGARRDAGELARDALASLEHQADADSVVFVIAYASAALHGPTTIGRRLALLQHLHEAGPGASNPDLRADALLVELTAVTELGDGARTASVVRNLDKLADATNAPGVLWRRAVARAWRAVLLGRCGEARTLLREVREADPTPERSMFSAVHLFMSSIVQRQMGQIDASRAAVEALGLIFPGLAALRAERAACTAWLGDTDTALDLLDGALAAMGGPDDEPGWLTAMLLASEVAVAAGHEELAAGLVAELRPFDRLVDAGPMPLSRVAGSVPEHLAALYEVLGDLDTSEIYSMAATELAQLLQSPYHEARARLRWAQMLQRRAGNGDAERCREQAELAKALTDAFPQWGLRYRIEELVRLL